MALRVVLLLSLLSWCPAVAAVSCSSNPGAAPLGQEYWQDLNDPNYLLALDGRRLIVSYAGRVREVLGILSQQGAETARICYSGRETTTVLRQQGDELVFHDPFRDQTHRLWRRRGGGRPASLSLDSFLLPAPSAMGVEKVQEVRRELWQRSQGDQAALGHQRQLIPAKESLPWLKKESSIAPDPQDPRQEIQFADLAMKNIEYLRGLLLEVGWIDVQRFGYGASNSAFLLLQHSWDVPVMVAVLPYLKKDVDQGLMESDTYALLYDRLQLALGSRQRYGSQIARTPQGEIFVLPVEDKPAEVDSLRHQLGLIPLADYVHVFGASTVQFSSDCQPHPE
jgi:hypothetical protein